jgi:hypothetical protein
MNTAFVLGNGVSRQAVDLAQLSKHGDIYGCNALYREFAPSVLVSTDDPISSEIQKSGYSQDRRHYTRKPLSNSGSHKMPAQYYGFSSGPAAVGIAALDHKKTIYLVGFDMGPTKHGLFNNVYAGTEFYKATTSVPTYTGNWVRQLLQITKDFPKVAFVRVIGDTTARIQELDGAVNFRNLSMEDFLDRINNAKDL